MDTGHFTLKWNVRFHRGWTSNACVFGRRICFNTDIHFTETLKITSFSSSDIIEISGAIKCILHGAGDWDGGRKERISKEEPESAHAEK